MTIVVVPGKAAARARSLLEHAGWRSEKGPTDADLAEALSIGSGGCPVLFVPAAARIARGLSRILVLHEGTPSATAAVQVADEAACASGAEITVLHVPTPEMLEEPGSLHAPRMLDHAPHEWSEWRSEFERRFCRCSPGVSIKLDVTTGPPSASILAVARRLRPNLIIATWKGDPRPGRAELLKATAQQAPCPVLFLVEG